MSGTTKLTQKEQIFDVLREDLWKNPTEITTDSGVPHRNVYVYLGELVREGRVEKRASQGSAVRVEFRRKPAGSK